MNYSIIEDKPENHADYVKVPGTDCREEFIKSLVGLLRQDTFHIYTDAIPIEWAVMAEKAAKTSHYLMMLLQVPVNFGETGTAYGIFYFQRQPTEPKKAN
jgi:hypothetical protein